MADRLAFKDEVLRRRLEVLGYTNISPESMNEIRGDLELLVQQESSPSERAMNVSAVCSEYSTPSQLPHAPWPGYAECPVATERSADPYLSRTVQASAQPPSAQPQSDQTIASTRLVSWDCLRELTNAQPSRASCSGDACSTSSSSTSSSGHNGMNLRRKVLRHMNGETLVCDESPQSDMDSVSNDEFLPPPVASGEDSGSVIESEVCSTNNLHTQVLPRSAPDVHRSAGCEDGYYAVNYPSLIRPMEHPHTRNLKKMDPVARYFQYKEEWENFQPPGENPRKHLRWQIREQMWYKDEVFQKPQHAVTVNHYVVPTEKKRLALRWEVRHDLAQGIMPRSFYSPL